MTMIAQLRTIQKQAIAVARQNNIDQLVNTNAAS
jgi:hypothetical protein